MTYMDDDDKSIKITFQRCNGYVRYTGKIVQLLYINFIH